MRYSYLIFVLLIFGCQPKHDVPVSIELNKNWQFKKAGDTIWNSATVPGNIFSDLLENKQIKDPFIGDNEKDVQWVSEADWEYKTTFLVSKKILQKKHIELNFEGLDTYASVFLNDSLILKTNNAFRSFEVDIKENLKAENELRILFENTSKYEEIEKEKLGYELPEGNRIFTRKAQFQYGWDWGPKLNTSGIWRPIKLVAWNDFRIKNKRIKTIELNDSISKLVAGIEYAFNMEKDITQAVYVNDSLVREKQFNPSNYNSGIPFQIKNPKLWWPHNLGEPYLYDIKVVVKDDKKILDSVSTKYGIRDIELVTEKDSVGENFYFKINNQPVYAKGANYIPQHSFQNQVTDAHYEKLLDDVVDVNMNMLRVWGGGIYENDIFYDLCDEKGILIWQDFMFACAMYPGDDAFLETVKQEAIDNVKRLRNHASIALWCGNNENSEGWHRWGWQAGRSDEEKEEIWNNYLKVFDSILPETVSKYTDTDYWESSPKYGRGNPKYKTEGDAHDWWIWHDAYPFEHLEDNVPRFMSEFGFQSFPSYETIKYINQNDSIEISSEGFKNHQKHIRGFQLIDEYMKRDFPVPDNGEDYVYMSQLLQAYGMRIGFEAQRRVRPYNMGTLYWQLNDCWPVISWSSIDFLGNWKAMHYKTKKAFADVLISSRVENDTLRTWIVNDLLEAKSGTLKSKLMDFDGKTIWETSKQVEASENKGTLVQEIDLNTIDFNKKEAVLISEFNNKTAYHYFTNHKNLSLKSSTLTIDVAKAEEGFNITLSSSTLEKDVFLFTNEKGHFSDNFFDILPNEVVTIHFKTDAETLENLQHKTFNSFVRETL
ncbi:beta-mannosidase [Winogradskyella wandonensis]|uniref:Beta-mannosidase B n=1 Tax=Winogradskyella wandonensis TaxID=1442586 RepID=A0A4R1KRI0_9FLAO|nr:glycoside hydrolase family 2 protein [Winogradskyella wandonensis]TCK67602.1 beta-mannosidase [Winogradskyella wandonensis]